VIGGTEKLEQPLEGSHGPLMLLGNTVTGEKRLVPVARPSEVVVAFVYGASARRDP